MENIQSTMSSKNQVVIPARVRQALKLKPGHSLLWHVISDNKHPKVIAQPRPKNWTAYAQGLGQDLWQDTNLDTYINALREEWQLHK